MGQATRFFTGENVNCGQYIYPFLKFGCKWNSVMFFLLLLLESSHHFSPLVSQTDNLRVGDEGCLSSKQVSPVTVIHHLLVFSFICRLHIRLLAYELEYLLQPSAMLFLIHLGWQWRWYLRWRKVGKSVPQISQSCRQCNLLKMLICWY